MNPVHAILAALFAILFAVFFVYVAFQLKSPDIKYDSKNTRESDKPGSTG